MYRAFPFIYFVDQCTMENIEKIIDLLHKRKVIRNEQFGDEEKKQITEYNNLMYILQTIKGSYFCVK